MKVTTDEGNEIEVFTQEELDAAIAENKIAVVPPVAVVEKKVDEIPGWAKEMKDQIEKLGGTVQESTNSTFINGVSAGLDADKAKSLKTKFDTLTGYEETPEGKQRRAEDAYLLTIGERYADSGVNLSNLSNPSGGKNTVVATKLDTAADKEIQAALGITPADIEKYKI